MTNKTGGKHVPGAKWRTRAVKIYGNTAVLERCRRTRALRFLVAGPQVQAAKVYWAFVDGVAPGWER